MSLVLGRLSLGNKRGWREVYESIEDLRNG
jgi:hypothetical protein